MQEQHFGVEQRSHDRKHTSPGMGRRASYATFQFNPVITSELLGCGGALVLTSDGASRGANDTVNYSHDINSASHSPSLLQFCDTEVCILMVSCLKS